MRTSDCLDSDVVLRDGTTALVRPVRPDDRQGLRELVGGLSLRSAYLRFFTVPRSPDAEVNRLLTGGDHLVALVAEISGRIAGIASFTIDPNDARTADVAFAVADRAQGHGIGTRLLQAMAEIARERGVVRFGADVLGENDQMLQVFRDSGFALQQNFGAGVYHVTMALDGTPDAAALAAARAGTAAAASMRPLFRPRSVAVVGASPARGKIGAEILHNLVRTGFTGQLVAVHPSASAIDTVPAYPRVIDIPHAVDLAVIAVPADGVQAVVDDCVTKGVKALVVITAGFGETGDAGRAKEAELLAAVRRAGIRMVGPNCMGLLNTDPAVRLNATFSPVFPPAGRVAMLSQSGALGLAILDHARRLGIGLSTFVSVGNKADVSANDLLHYWEQDADTDVVLLYLESFGNPRKFSQIARRLSRRKPIVAVKAGRSKVGARAASSHTGALAASDDVVDALFRQCGVIRTDTMEELFDVTRLLAEQPVPAGRRVAIVTNAGGPGILAADACEARGLELPALSASTTTLLRSLLPAAASVANPIDMLASATPDQYERVLGAVLADPGIDSAIVLFIPPLVTAGEDVARAVRRTAAAHASKTVLTVFMGSAPAADLLRPVPSFVYPEPAAAALARVAAYGEWRRAPEGTTPTFPDVDAEQARAIVRDVLARGGGWAGPDEAARLLGAAGIQVLRAQEAIGEDMAVHAAAAIGYPVALKAFGPAIVHKTELGAIRLGVASAGELRDAYRDLAARLGSSMTGVLVQEMAGAGVDMLIGAVEDPSFGPVIACALGGTTAEIFADSAFRLAPLNDLDARAMVETLRSAPLLRGYRGQPVADEAALRESLLRLSTVVMLCPEIQEIDVNPLRVSPQGVRALDVRVRIDRPPARPNLRKVQY